MEQICRKCRQSLTRSGSGMWTSDRTGTWCVEETSHETAEQQRERVAKAIRTEYVATERPDRPSWEDTPDHRKAKWLRMADAAIGAF